MTLSSRTQSESTRLERIAASPVAASAGPPSTVPPRSRLAVSIRPVTSGDEALIFAFLADLSLGSRRQRFFSAAVDLRAEAHRGAAGDDADHHGVLAILSDRGVVGHAVYVRLPASDRAEVAVEVADDLHRRGLATMLLINLAQVAEARQIKHFFAEVLPENRDMLTIFADGFGAECVVRQDEVDIEFSTSSWPRAQAGLEPGPAVRDR
jgi:GNAT superfamily N-acetyltransferase